MHGVWSGGLLQQGLSNSWHSVGVALGRYEAVGLTLWLAHHVHPVTYCITSPPCRNVPYCARRIPHVVGSGGDPYCHVGRWVSLDAAGGAAVHETHKADEVRDAALVWVENVLTHTRCCR